MSNFLLNLITSLVSVYALLILAAVMFSWFRPGTGRMGQLREFVDSLTAPYLRLFRRIIPPLGRFDFSPIVALITLQLVGGAAAAAVTSL
jgi:YggT family protein